MADAAGGPHGPVPTGADGRASGDTVGRDARSGRALDVGPVTLWVHDEGPVDAPVVVLVGGADDPAFRWTRAWVAPLVAAGYRVVRYDQRDSGRSELVHGDYGLDELAGDLVALLDTLGIGRAHLVGRSLGGMVVQRVALDRPDRVGSIVLVSTTPGPDPRLPEPEAELVADLARHHLTEPSAPTVAERVERRVARQALLAGPRHPFEAGRERALARAEVELGLPGPRGHGPAATTAPSRLGEIGAIGAPTLVVHGDADRVFPVEHARALAARVPGARLVLVAGLGHELPDAAAPELVPLILEHLAGADGAGDRR